MQILTELFHQVISVTDYVAYSHFSPKILGYQSTSHTVISIEPVSK